MPTKQFGVAFDAATTPLDGTETLSVVQDGVTVDTTTQDIADLGGGGGMTNPMTTLGDIIIGDTGGTPDRLPIGTNGQVLTVVSGSPAWAAGGSGGGAMELVASQTVSGAAVTTVTFPSLDLATDGRYQFEIEILNATGSATSVSLYVNGDTTATNYHNQINTGAAAALTGSRVNSGKIFDIASSSNATCIGDMVRDVSGRPRTKCSTVRDDAANIVSQDAYHIRNNTDNVTSITFGASVASSIGIGSRFKLYKIG